jgi:tetratricopeptide (TPR) repeat protein
LYRCFVLASLDLAILVWLRYDVVMKINLIYRAFFITVVLSAAAVFAAEPQPKKSAALAKPLLSVNQSRPPLSTEQVLYQFLLSEIAAQRGRTELATQGMMDLAARSNDARIARRATEMAFQAKQMGDAREALMLWLAIEPDSGVARQALSAMLGTQSSTEKTSATVLQWLGDKSFEQKHAATLFSQLPFLFSRITDRKAVAMTVAELALPYPHLAEAQYAVGMTALAAGNRAAALAALESALVMRAEFNEAAIAIARLHFDSNENGDKLAENYLATYLKRFPDATDVRIAYGRLLVGMKSLLSAREQFRQAATARTDEPDMPYAIGLISLQIEDWADAEKQFLLAIKRNPRDKNPIHFNLGLVAEGKKDGDPNAARRWYQQITDGEYFINAQLKIAQLITKRDGVEAGRAFLRDAQKVQKEQDGQVSESDTAQTRQQLVIAEVQLLREAKAYSEAYQVLTEAVANWPTAVELRYDRAMIAEKLEKLDAMEADLRTVIAMKPDHAHAHNALGYSFAERGIKLNEALTLIEQAVKISPTDAFIQDSLGWVFYRLGRYDEALATLKKAYTMRRDPEIAAHLGEVLFHTGSRAEALAIWQNALKDFPDHPALIAVMARHAK